MDLDLDDPGLGRGPSRSSRFLPKSSKMKPNPKSEPSSEESKPVVVVADAAPVMVKQEDSKMVVDPIIIIETATTDTKMEDVAKPEQEQEQEQQPMEEEEEEEDKVVREIDVFLQPSPIDSNTLLYVVQQPTRPAWRPYEMDRDCLEVRVKPKSGKVEIDLKLEVDKNYEENVDDYKKITKKSLVSQSAPLRTGYAVGVLAGNELHLHPVHTVVQLRQSLKHVNSGGLKSNASQNVEALVDSSLKNDTKKQVKIVPPPIEQVNIVDEPWVPLQYYGLDSSFSSKYRRIMAMQQTSSIPFSMSLEDYVNSLCPGPSAETNKVKGRLKSDCLSLPLDERFKKWFREGRQVNRFNTLKHLALNDSNEDLLDVLQRYADLVQGLWVSKSKLLGLQGEECIVRDYVLLLFTKNARVLHKELENSGFSRDKLKGVMNALAYYRSTFKDWKFKEPTDVSFINEHPNIVREQEKHWEIRAKKIAETVGSRRGGSSLRNSLKPSMSNKPSVVCGTSEQGARKNVDGTANSVTLAMSDETREALPNALKNILRLHKVCNLQFICQSLRDLAVNQSNLPKADSRVAVAAARAVSAPLPELELAVNKVAIKIHGVYVLKSSEDAALNQLRGVVIDLLSVKEPNAKLKRADIVEYAKTVLKREINNHEYSQQPLQSEEYFLKAMSVILPHACFCSSLQVIGSVGVGDFSEVLNELCFSVKGNAWVLKTGDGSRHPT